MKRSFVFTPDDGVPPRVAPLFHASAPSPTRRWGDLRIVAGQMPTDPATCATVTDGIVPWATQVRRNPKAVPAQHPSEGGVTT
jgi:2-iminobutanoate/2-iminopropanoate deaminase